MSELTPNQVAIVEAACEYMRYAAKELGRDISVQAIHSKTKDDIVAGTFIQTEDSVISFEVTEDKISRTKVKNTVDHHALYTG